MLFTTIKPSTHGFFPSLILTNQRQVEVELQDVEEQVLFVADHYQDDRDSALHHFHVLLKEHGYARVHVVLSMHQTSPKAVSLQIEKAFGDPRVVTGEMIDFFMDQIFPYVNRKRHGNYRWLSSARHPRLGKLEVPHPIQTSAESLAASIAGLEYPGASDLEMHFFSDALSAILSSESALALVQERPFAFLGDDLPLPFEWQQHLGLQIYHGNQRILLIPDSDSPDQIEQSLYRMIKDEQPKPLALIVKSHQMTVPLLVCLRKLGIGWAFYPESSRHQRLLEHWAMTDSPDDRRSA